MPHSDKEATELHESYSKWCEKAQLVRVNPLLFKQTVVPWVLSYVGWIIEHLADVKKRLTYYDNWEDSREVKELIDEIEQLKSQLNLAILERDQARKGWKEVAALVTRSSG